MFLSRKIELEELYISTFLKFSSLAIINIFIPIYLFNLEFPLQSIFLFYAVWSLSHFSMCPIAAKIASKIGFKHAIMIANPMLIITFFLLSHLPTIPDFFFLVAITGGISGGLYWVPFHTDFTISSDKKNRGKEVALLSLTIGASSVLGPLIGAVLILSTGFSFTFIIAALIIFLSIVPLFFTKDSKLHPKFSFKDINKFDTLYFKTYIITNIFSVNNMERILLPLFIFFFLSNYLFLGGLQTIGLFAALMASMVAGTFFDKYGTDFILKSGSVIVAFVWLSIQFITVDWHFFIFVIFLGVFTSFREVSFETYYYNAARKSHDVVQFTVLREMSIHIGIILGMLVLYFLAVLVEGITSLFALASIGSLLYLLIVRKNKKKGE